LLSLKWLSKIRHFFTQKVKYTASDPTSFGVHWTFRAKRIQLLSLLLILLLLIMGLSGLLILKGPLSFYFTRNDITIERQRLEEQNLKIRQLNTRLSAQDKYLQTLKTILNGQVIKDAADATVPEAFGAIDDLETEETATEKELSAKVRSDLRTGKVRKRDNSVPFFASPVKGTISQRFTGLDHAGVDIVTEKGRTVLSCLAGTVIYSGYTQKDGYILVIEHANSYISIYKHNKAVLKRSGQKVQMNDPIAIVGNTGENSSGPHLHFELWHNQIALDPEKYIDFGN
jgi:murein DD-endopeptidase MepM/ murein hydrolase activator NlpD